MAWQILFTAVVVFITAGVLLGITKVRNTERFLAAIMLLSLAAIPIAALVGIWG